MLEGVCEESSSGSLRVGLASKSIAPSWPVVLPYGKQVPLLDFYNRNIFCKSVVFEVGELRLVWLVFDVIGFREKEANEIKREVFEKTGVSVDYIILSAVHNHSYPSPCDPKILDLLKKRAVECVEDAFSNMFEAKIGFGKKKLPSWINENRRKPGGYVDTTLYVTKICDLRGAVRGVIFVFPSHPTMLTTAWGGSHPGKIGPEWPEYVRKYVESKINIKQLVDLYPSVEYRDVETVFLMGAAGDMQISSIWGDKRERLKMLFKTLGDSIVELVESINVFDKVCLEFRRARIRFPVKRKYINWFKKNYYSALVQVLILNDACFAIVPCEVTADLGVEFVKRCKYEYPVLVTTSNDYLGYFTPELEALEELTYEGRGSFLEASRGRILVNSLLELIGEKTELLKPVDVNRDMGTIEGRVVCEDISGVHVGVLREYRAPAYGDPPSAPMYGRRVKVDEQGRFVFRKIAPGTVYLYVDREVAGRKRPLLLTWGEPVKVSPGNTVYVELSVPSKLKGTRVENIEIVDLLYENHSIVLRAKVKGILGSEEYLRAHLYYTKDFFKPHRLCLTTPLAIGEQISQDTFIFKEIPPGDYVAVVWIDVNDNNRLEPGVDKMSKPRVIRVSENILLK
ncbi:MAG: hypothetical protein DRJ63_06380 [Thermoprotei archaeon]|nr:MAG: hypothetical protein DRJ63_06380 [Thermoprotei archaeon]